MSAPASSSPPISASASGQPSLVTPKVLTTALHDRPTPPRCHILETGNDSFRFKNSSAKAAEPAKEKPQNLTNA